jgi:hypothetical protein
MDRVTIAPLVVQQNTRNRKHALLVMGVTRVEAVEWRAALRASSRFDAWTRNAHRLIQQ